CFVFFLYIFFFFFFFFFLFFFFFFIFFFFSSRRRHTRFDCDWSSECALPICPQASSKRARRSILRRPRRRPLRRPLLLDKHRPAAARRDGPVRPQAVFRSRGSCRIRSEERRVGKECRFRWVADRGVEIGGIEL